jgi:hypothetical protein
MPTPYTVKKKTLYDIARQFSPLRDGDRWTELVNDTNRAALAKHAYVPAGATIMLPNGWGGFEPSGNEPFDPSANR